MHSVVSTAGVRCACDSGYVQGTSGVCDVALCDDGHTFCLNSGSCIDGGAGQNQCVCPPGITGTNCETGNPLFPCDILLFALMNCSVCRYNLNYGQFTTYM